MRAFEAESAKAFKKAAKGQVERMQEEEKALQNRLVNAEQDSAFAK